MLGTVALPINVVEPTSALSRQDVIERNLPLVKFVVGRMSGLIAASDMDTEDAISQGCLGLIAAVDNFDASRGAALSTYAVQRIRGALLDEARRRDPLSRGHRSRVRTLDVARRELVEISGREPTRKELALKTGLSELQVRSGQIGPHQQIVSLESLREGYDRPDLELPDHDESVAPEIVADRQAVRQAVGAAVRELPARDRLVIDMRFRKGMTMRSIGETLRVSESRASQICTKALKSLRRDLVHEGIDSAA